MRTGTVSVCGVERRDHGRHVAAYRLPSDIDVRRQLLDGLARPRPPALARSRTASWDRTAPTGRHSAPPARRDCAARSATTAANGTRSGTLRVAQILAQPLRELRSSAVQACRLVEQREAVQRRFVLERDHLCGHLVLGKVVARTDGECGDPSRHRRREPQGGERGGLAAHGQDVGRCRRVGPARRARAPVGPPPTRTFRRFACKR